MTQREGDARYRQTVRHFQARAAQRRGEDIDVPPAPEPELCVECGEAGSETDHHLALSVAHEHRLLGDTRWWRAWTPSNLRPLCHGCHATKTGSDRRELARLRTRQPALL